MFDIDTTTIPPDELRRIRKSLDKLPHELSGRKDDYPSQKNMAERMGIGANRWSYWECGHGARGLSAAMARLYLEEGVTFDGAQGVSAEEASALVDMVMEVQGLDSRAEACRYVAAEFGVTAETVRHWIRRGKRHCGARLVRYFVDLFGCGREEEGEAFRG